MLTFLGTQEPISSVLLNMLSVLPFERSCLIFKGSSC